MAAIVVAMATPDDPIPQRLPGVVAGRVVGWAAVVEGHLANRGDSTRAAYETAIRQWDEWCEHRGVDPLAAGRVDVQTWVDHLRQAGRRPKTIKQRLAAVRGAYQWALDEELLTRNPAARVKGPRVDEDSTTLGLSKDELERFLAAADADSLSSGALMRLLAFNGLRASEPVAADVADLKTERGQRVLKVIRKGGKTRTHPLGNNTAAALDRHLDGRRRGPLFPHPRTGARLDRHDVYRLVVRLADEAGLDPGITPHSLRHTFVTLSLDAGVDLVDVQDAADHSDPRTTRHYDRNRNRLDRHPTYRLDRLFDPDEDQA